MGNRPIKFGFGASYPDDGVDLRVKPDISKYEKPAVAAIVSAYVGVVGFVCLSIAVSIGTTIFGCWVVYKLLQHFGVV